MSRLRNLWLLAFLFSVPEAFAQQIGPHIAYVYPAGGRQGTSFEVNVGGQFLTSTTQVYITGNGVQAQVLDSTRPMNTKLKTLLDRVHELQSKQMRVSANLVSTEAGSGKKKNYYKTKKAKAKDPAWTTADDRELEAIRKRLFYAPNRATSPALAECAGLRITLAANAAPGMRELRLRTTQGLSNPLGFYVSQLPEYHEPRLNLELLARKFVNPGQQTRSQTKTDLRINLPAVVNGQIMPSEVDRYRFSARQGQRLVATVAARELVPYLADAVPGWFQATLALYDAQGRELAYGDDFEFNPDPVLYYQIPADGEYSIAIKDAIYRGREDFVYRITLGELPFVTNIFPLGGPAGAKTTVELVGWNLPTDRLTTNAQTPGLYQLCLHQGNWFSNQVPFAVDTLPECLEKEPNEGREKVQAVTLPIIVNGRINKPGDTDVIRFSGRAGDQVYAEVTARRLNSPLDSVLRLTYTSGKQLAFNDDHADTGAGLTTHQADSLLSATLPTSGDYCLELSDGQKNGGPEYTYRLRISAPRPDYELRVTPSSVNARTGAIVPLAVYALRKDGFTGAIDLSLPNTPRGFMIQGGRIPPGQDMVRITMTVPARLMEEPFNINVEGRAIIQGKPVTRLAVPAEDMMQAFFYRHLVTQKDLKVHLLGRGWAFNSPVNVLGAMPVRIPVGGTARVALSSGSSSLTDLSQVELNDPPEGLSIKELIPSRKGTMLVLACEKGKVKPGTAGNLIVNIFVKQETTKKTKSATSQRGTPISILPAIPFEVAAGS